MDTNHNALKEIEAARAYQDGRRAGRDGRPATDAPGYAGEFMHEQWLCGWRLGDAERRTVLLLEEQRQKRSVALACSYQRGLPCDCNLAGLCLDVA